MAYIGYIHYLLSAKKISVKKSEMKKKKPISEENEKMVSK